MALTPRGSISRRVGFRELLHSKTHSVPFGYVNICKYIMLQNKVWSLSLNQGTNAVIVVAIYLGKGRKGFHLRILRLTDA